MKKNILVIDDRRDHRRVISDLLQSTGYEVELAGNYDEALQKLRSGVRFHLAVIDLMLPPHSGIEILKEIKKDEELLHRDHLPVIFITAYLEDPRVAELKAQNIPVIGKPFRYFQDFLDVVAEELNNGTVPWPK